ncbi:MAG: ATP-binding protein [Candidatus Bipolaricaulota bacterium]|nr:ATP-binding protein [Candidatus Bipolaricaulota bacterium]
MASELNAVEKTIIIVVAYGIATLTIIILSSTGVRSPELIFLALAVPLIIGACFLNLRGGIFLGLFTTGIGVLFPEARGPLRSFVLLATNLSLGGGIGLVNSRRQLRKERWQRAKSLKEPFDNEIFENSLNMVHFIDRDGNILRRNETSRSTLGYATKRTLQLAEYVHPNDIDQMKVELSNLFERGELREVESRFVSQERHVIPVELKGTRATERLAVLEAHDLSQQAELKRRLMETEARYRYLIEDAIDTLDSGIIITDRKHQVVWANKTIGRFFGIDREKLIGIDALLAFSRYAGVFEKTEKVKNMVREAIETGKRVDSSTFYVRPGLGRDERTLEYKSIPIETERYAGGRIDHYIDITEIKRLDEGLREKTKRLEQSNTKLEEFSRVVSHDLKEPLRTLETFSDFLLEDYSERLDDEGASYLKSLKNSSSRMREMIDDLRALSSIHVDRASFQRVDVGRIIEDTKEDLKIVLQGINLQVTADPPPVMGVKTRITELFRNLITNAIKFNDKALPTIKIGWVEGTKAGEKVHTFFVQDNGIGIETRYHERIFELFEKLDPREHYEGTGAGLSICKRIVEEHGGEIWVESEVGKGTTFYFTIPKALARKEVEIHA